MKLRKRFIAQACSIGFCLVMTGWLVRYEAFPGAFSERVTGYRSMLSTGALLVDQWTKITYQGAPIGYSHTQLASHEEDEDEVEAIRLQNRTYFKLKMLGQSQRIIVTATMSLDSAYRLQRFAFALSTSPYSIRIHGERRAGQHFDVELRSADSISRTDMVIPDDVVVYSPMTEMSLRRLKPGQSLRIKTLDPVSLTVADIHCRALQEESVDFRGETVAAMKLEVAYRGTSVYAWMDASGRIIRQETPLGWVMEASDQDEALNLDFDAEAMADMILANAVALNGALKRPAEARRIELRLTGLLLDPAQLASHRQAVTLRADGAVDVQLERQLPPLRGLPLGAAPKEFEPFLEATPFIQSDHPDLVEQARLIVGDSKDCYQAARRIYDWVEANVRKTPAVSLPSALDVLKQRVGDCNEHTYLFVGLARAAGIPAQIRIGLVYNHGAFYYHAWPSVYVGEWVEMDPTLRQPLADATHLALLEGEIGNQLELMKVFGQLAVDLINEVQ